MVAAAARRDLAAGLSVAGLLLPEALAYSSIARLPAQAGVVGLLCGLLAYALFGRSRFAIVSATSSSAALVAAISSGLISGAPGGRGALAAALVLLTGAALLAAAAARLGAVAGFIARPVLRGFAFGLALTIALRQFARAAGVETHSPFVFGSVVELLQHWTDWRAPSLLVGALSLLALTLLGRWPRWPGALLVLVTATAAVAGLQQVGWAGAAGIARVGAVAMDWSAPTWPDLPLSTWQRLGETAFAVTLVLFAESNAAIRGAAIRHGEPTEPNRDLAALGVANALSGLFQGLPVGAGFSATSANEAADPGSRLAGAWAAVTVLLAIWLALPLVAWIPEATLAAVVIHAVGAHLVSPALRDCFRWRRDRLVLAASALAVLLLGVLDGLLVGVGASLLLALRDLSRSAVTELVRLDGGHAFVDRAVHPQEPPEPGLLLLRPEAPLFFASTDGLCAEVLRRVRLHPEAHTVVLSLEETPDLDSSAIEALRELLAQLTALQRRLVLARVHQPVAELLQRAGLPDLDAAAITPPSVDDAVRLALAPAPMA
jgi:sulfate permease, SulP family